MKRLARIAASQRAEERITIHFFISLSNPRTYSLNNVFVSHETVDEFKGGHEDRTPLTSSQTPNPSNREGRRACTR